MLFDTVPIDKIVFLIDANTEETTVRALLQERWEKLRLSSPNLEQPAPAARLYRMTAQNNAELRGFVRKVFTAAAA